MDIIKNTQEYILSEYSKDNKQPYRSMYNFLMKLYRDTHKQIVKSIQLKYNKKRNNHIIVKDKQDNHNIVNSNHNIVDKNNHIIVKIPTLPMENNHNIVTPIKQIGIFD